jgi:hypothetical protein
MTTICPCSLAVRKERTCAATVRPPRPHRVDRFWRWYDFGHYHSGGSKFGCGTVAGAAVAHADTQDCPTSVDVAEVGVTASPVGTYPAASHVEIKAAVAMRDAGEAQGVIVINNPTGPCPGDLGCTTETVFPPESFITIPELRKVVTQWAFGDVVPPPAARWIDMPSVGWF